MTNARNILLIDDDPQRASNLSDALKDTRYQVRHLASPSAGLLREVDSIQPDIIMIDIESPSRDMLESLHMISDYSPKPVVMFSSEEDEELINLSVQSGVSAYVVGGAEPARVKSILDTAVARFNEYQKLRNELQKTKDLLEAKTVIHQAKRLLMEHKGMSENDAFHSMRKTAMDSGQKIEDVARTILSIMKNFKR